MITAEVDETAGMTNQKRQIFSRILLVLLVISLVMTTGCTKKSAIGAINDRATLAVLQFEKIEEGVSGIVYREVNDFEALVGTTKTPLLLAFYNPMAEVNAQVIPQLEQMADDDQGKLTILWIDATSQLHLAESFGANNLPQFTVMVDATVKRSLVGFDSQGPEKLKQLVSPYLKD
jgi:thioredoxin-like negative regulator of GroEL